MATVHFNSISASGRKVVHFPYAKRTDPKMYRAEPRLLQSTQKPLEVKTSRNSHTRSGKWKTKAMSAYAVCVCVRMRMGFFLFRFFSPSSFSSTSISHWWCCVSSDDCGKTVKWGTSYKAHRLPQLFVISCSDFAMCRLGMR